MQNQKQSQVKALSQLNYILPVFLFLAGLLPRLVALATFLTPDEYRWLGRSRNFLAGIVSGDWAATLQTGHPGVTTMWTGSLGILYNYWTRSPAAPDDLLAFVEQVSAEPLDVAYIAPMRLPTVLLMALLVVAFYVLVSHLFGDRRVGATAALLLALSPFHIALSRVLHHDALATAFMTLSLLPLLGYWLKGWSGPWLVLSAVAAGLSFLSKSSAMFLMPFCALLGLFWAGRRWRRGDWHGWSDFRRLVVVGLLWGAVAWLTVFLLWPAMWVNPLEALESMFGLSLQYATEGHGKGNFLLGQITSDPGPLFYPLNWLLRTTPLTLVGLLAWGLAYRRQGTITSSSRILAGTLLLYAALFTVFMATVEKKQDRYILPIFPALEIVAALGLVQILTIGSIPQAPTRTVKEKRGAGMWTLLCGRRFLNPTAYRPKFPHMLALVTVLQGVLALTTYPYYFTYYNPLLGGASMAGRLTTVGWGEGIDQAATYLNSQPGAGNARVTSWYHLSFAPFFQGQAAPYASDAGQTLSSDYAVLYRNQIQRELPTSELTHYLLQHQSPVFTVTLQGLDYVYIYDLPLDRPSDWQASRLPGQATFFGLGQPDAGTITPKLRLYWQNEGLAAGEEWWIALQPMDGPPNGWQMCSLGADFAAERSLVGALLENECWPPDQDLPPGVYHVRVGVGTDVNQVRPLPFPAGELAVVVSNRDQPRLVSRLSALDVLAEQALTAGALPTNLVYQGAVRLIGYAIANVSTTEQAHLQVDLHWQALETLPLAELERLVASQLALQLPQGEPLTSIGGPFTFAETGSSEWSAGQVLSRTYLLPLSGPVPAHANLVLSLWFNGQLLTPRDSSGQPIQPTLPVVTWP
jgi:hypothetical protein